MKAISKAKTSIFTFLWLTSGLGKVKFFGPETPRGVYLKTYTEIKNLISIKMWPSHARTILTDRESHFIILDDFSYTIHDTHLTTGGLATIYIMTSFYLSYAGWFFPCSSSWWSLLILMKFFFFIQFSSVLFWRPQAKRQ